MRFSIYAFVSLLSLSAVQSVEACEPIIPVFQLFAGSSTIGASGIYAKSLVALCIAVAIKTILFIRFEQRLPWYLAATAIILANSFSTVIGLGLAIAASSGGLILPLTIIVFFVSIPPAFRFVRFNPWDRLKFLSSAGPLSIAAAIASLYLLTFVLFAAAAGTLYTPNAPGDPAGGAPYWILKLAYIYVGLAVSLFLTAAWEEAVVAPFAANGVETPYFLPSVLRANVYTLLLVFIYGAFEVLPKRLASPDFLIGQLIALLKAGGLA